MASGFKPLYYDESNVGRHIKSSKIRVTWKLELNQNPLEVNLYISRMSGKRKVFVDGYLKTETKK